jgi:hypothetical protein
MTVAQGERTAARSSAALLSTQPVSAASMGSMNPSHPLVRLAARMRSLPSYRPFRWGVLWDHPEFVFLPSIVILFVVSDAPSIFGPQYAVRFGAYLSNPNQGGIFPFTWTASWCTFLIATYAGVRWTSLRLPRSILVAASLPFGATGVFELVYQFTGSVVQPWGFNMAAFAWFDLVLWTAVGFTSCVYWRITWDYLVLLGLFALGFIAWAAIGYPQITWGTIAQQPIAYGLNVALKGGAFALFLLPTLRGWQTVRTDRVTSGGDPLAIPVVPAPSESPHDRVRLDASPGRSRDHLNVYSK